MGGCTVKCAAYTLAAVSSIFPHPYLCCCCADEEHASDQSADSHPRHGRTARQMLEAAYATSAAQQSAASTRDPAAEAVYRKRQKRRKLGLFIRLQQAKRRRPGKTASRRKKAARQPNFSDQAVQRRLNRTMKHIGVALCKAEMQENKVRVSRSGKILDSNPRLRKPCGGSAVYQPASGPAVTSATSKLNEACKARGGMKRILRIADEKNFSSDGGRNDPSVVTLLQHIVAEIIGEKTEQGDVVVQSGRTPVLVGTLHSCADAFVCSCKQTALLYVIALAGLPITNAILCRHTAATLRDADSEATDALGTSSVPALCCS